MKVCYLSLKFETMWFFALYSLEKLLAVALFIENKVYNRITMLNCPYPIKNM